MEQLAKLPFELEALAKGANGSLSPFHLTISEPEEDQEDCFFCRINCKFIAKYEKRVFGIDGEQAAELAFDLVGNLLEHKTAIIVDSDGNPLDVPWA